MPTISLKVSEETAAYLTAESKRLRVSKSRILREAIEERRRKSKSKKAKPSLYDRMKGGIGCIDSGVTDLSTNKKYMEGFGKWKHARY
jgi:hypothetical protein